MTMASGPHLGDAGVRRNDPLTLTVHTMPRAEVTEPDRQPDARQRRRGRLAMMLVLLCCAAPVIASYLTYFVIRPEGRTNHAMLMEPPREWPGSLALTTLEGKPVDTSILRKQWTLVAFGPATCESACEQRLFAQRQLREMLGRERDRLEKVFVVLDDGTLSTPVAQALAAAPATTIWRAPREATAAWLGVDAAQLDQSLYVVDPMGRWMMRTPPGTIEPAKFKRDLDRLLRASSSWDRAGR
jgi:hypothetical protein